MIVHPFFRRFLALVAVAGILGLAWAAIPTSLNQLPQRNTVSQSLQVYTSLIFGFFGILVVLMAFMWRQKAWIAEVVFVASGAVTAGMASVVWGRTSMVLGVVSFVTAGLITAILVWLLRFGLRDLGAVRP